MTNFKVVSKYLISKVTVFLIILVLVSGTINQVDYSVQAGTGSEEGEEEEGGTTEGGGDEEGTEAEAPPDSEVGDGDDANTEGVASEQENACPAVAFEGPSYVDENGCPAPCPPPPANAQDANIPEGCPQATEEQTVLPADTATPPGQEQQAPPDVGETPAIKTVIADRDQDGIGNAEDNCPGTFNPTSEETPTQEDTDADGIGDACDPDLMGQQQAPPPPDVQTGGLETGQQAPPDVGETPAIKTVIADRDQDGIGNAEDNCPDISNPTSEETPTQEDTDADGIGDACDSTPTGDDTEEFGGDVPGGAPFIPPK